MLLLSSMVAFAGGDEICYDCLTDFPLYRLEGPGDPHPEWRIDFYEAISVTVVFGVIGGGGGLVVDPSGHGTPIDPEWWFDVGTFRDSRDLAVQVDALTASLDRNRIGYLETTEVADTLRLEGSVAIVTPKDEGAAIAWLTENSKALMALDHPTLVFLQDGGAVIEKEIGFIQ
ncbi:MAG: hypothetical protein ABMB14_22620 [Myxococcota bacterium]